MRPALVFHLVPCVAIPVCRQGRLSPLVDLATTRRMLIYFANSFVPEVRNLIPHLPGSRLSSNKHFKFKFRNSTLFISTIFITLHLMIHPITNYKSNRRSFMALHAKTFKTRTITAAVFVVVMLSGLLINQWTFLILFSIIHFGCWIEYQKLIELIDDDYKNITPFHKYGVRLLGWGFMLWVTNPAFDIGEISLYEIGWWLLIILLIAIPVTEIVLSKQFNLKNFGYSLLGLLYISLGWGLMVNLRAEGILSFGSMVTFDLGWVIPVVLIASIWINDTMAYIVGSFIGKTPLLFYLSKKNMGRNSRRRCSFNRNCYVGWLFCIWIK